MGRGRAPCCDKSQVNRGPWSPAEDLRLISFIERHGHDNWRALPKRAGLLRCGKSCRLRWINYLRPDLKRGNFTKEEEETVIRLHQTMGNKWSKIASHLPGRTDNEIKNVWNTHLKKRLTRKEKTVASNRIQQAKECSVVTSSSSSSMTDESNSNHQRAEIQSQIKLLLTEGSQIRSEVTERGKTVDVPNPSNILPDQITGLQVYEPFNKCGFMPQTVQQLSDSSDNNQLEQFALWEEPNLLESLLAEIEDPNWARDYGPIDDYQIGLPERIFSHQLQMESDFGLWGMLNNDTVITPRTPSGKEGDSSHVVHDPMSEKSINAALEYINDKDIDSMLDCLEYELELCQTNMTRGEKQDLQHANGVNCSSISSATNNESTAEPSMDYHPQWPQAYD